MKSRQIMIWGLILVGLAFFIYQYEIIGGKQREEAEKSAKKVFKVSANDVSRLILSFDGKTIVMGKNDIGKWVLAKPVQAMADRGTIDETLRTITGIEFDPKRKFTGKLKDFGLEPAQMFLSITAEKNVTYTLLLGNENPTGSLLYAKFQNTPEVFLVPVSLKFNLTKDVFELRDKQLLHLAKDEVNQLKLRYPGQEIQLVRGNFDMWRIVKPQNLPADKEVVNALIGELNGLQIKKFEAETASDLAIYSLNKPQVEITAVSGKGNVEKIISLSKPMVIKEGGISPGVYAKCGDMPQIVLLDANVVSKFTKQVFDLRERRILAFDTTEVNKLQLNNNGQVINLERQGQGWQILTPRNAQAKEFMVQGLLFDLSQLKADEFIEQQAAAGIAAYGLDKPQLKVDLELDDKTKMSLTIGKRLNDKQVYVQQQDGKVFVVTADIIQQLSKKPEDIAKK